MISEGDIRDWWRVTDAGQNVWLIHGDDRLVAAATLWPQGDVPNVWGDVHPELEADDFDPDVWAIVRDGDDLAAVLRCDVFRFGGGWVAALGVRKPWRRRGIGLALLQRTFRLFHERGERSVALGVDSENPTGATRLYERAGMHVESETVTFEKQLS